MYVGTFDEGGTIHYNTYTWDQFVAAYGSQLSDCVRDDPEFVNVSSDNYQLQATSPAIDAGYLHDAWDKFQTLYGIDIRLDLTSRVIPLTGVDVGAYERG